jgi:hypothetical protein
LTASQTGFARRVSLFSPQKSRCGLTFPFAPQKCSQFHSVAAFAGTKRTCDKALASLRLRRPTRKSSARSCARAAPTPLLSPASAALFDDPSSAALHGANWQNDDELFSFVDALLGNGPGAASHELEPLLSGADDVAPPNRLRAAALFHDSCSAAALPAAHEAWLKLDGTTPASLPPSLAPALAAAWCADAALCLEAAPRPGCTLLHLDALLPADVPPPPDANALARALLASAAAPWLRARRVAVHVRGETAFAEPGSSWRTVHNLSSMGGLTPSPRTPRLVPLALLSTAPAMLRAPGWAGPPPGCTLWLRLHGQVCALRCEPGAAALPALRGAEGAAHLWLARDGLPGCASGASRAVLLTRDADIAAEVASLDADGDGDAEAEQLLCVLGAALRPGCAPRVLAAAAAAALRLGWEATAARLLPLLRAAIDAGACDAAASAAARTLLHAAALSGRPALVRLVLSRSHDGALGTPHAPGDHGLTPLHLAAAMGDGDTATALANSSPTALLGWFTARSRCGATPGAAALSSGGSAARAHAALTRRLHSARPLAAKLAAAVEHEGVSARSEPFEDEDLARFLLQTYAPADASDPATPAERKLYEAARMLLHRSHALCLPPFSAITAIRSLMMPLPSAEAIALVCLPDNLSWSAFTVYQGLQPTFVLVARLVVSFMMLAIAGLPQLRGAYVRHGRVVMRTCSVLAFLLFPVLTEGHVRHVLRVEICLPHVPGSLLASFLTVHLAFIPLPLRDILGLLAARWVLMLVARVTGAPIWPRPEAPFHFSSLVNTATHITCVIALVLMDRRAWAAWRSARRKRLVDSYVRFKDAAT